MHKKRCHRSTHQRKRREMQLVLLLLLAARGGGKARGLEEAERAREWGKMSQGRRDSGGTGRNQGCRQR